MHGQGMQQRSVELGRRQAQGKTIKGWVVHKLASSFAIATATFGKPCMRALT